MTTESTDSPVLPRPRGFLDPEPEGREEVSKKPERAPGDSGGGSIAFFERFVMVVNRKTAEGKEPIGG